MAREPPRLGVAATATTARPTPRGARGTPALAYQPVGFHRSTTALPPPAPSTTISASLLAAKRHLHRVGGGAGGAQRLKSGEAGEEPGAPSPLTTTAAEPSQLSRGRTLNPSRGRTQIQTNAQLRALTNAQMRDRLRALGLPVSGNKAVLIDKLETAFGHQPDEEPVESPVDAPVDAPVEEPAEEPAEEHPTNAQLRGLTNAQMRDRLRALGLPVGGNKAVLIDKLETAFRHQPVEEPAEEPAEEPVDEAADEHPTNAQLRGLTNAAMKARLRALGLPVSGNKAVLIGRLETAFGHQPHEEASDGEERPEAGRARQRQHPPGRAQEEEWTAAEAEEEWAAEAEEEWAEEAEWAMAVAAAEWAGAYTPPLLSST